MTLFRCFFGILSRWEGEYRNFSHLQAPEMECQYLHVLTSL